MKGTIGGTDGDGNFWCRACIEASEELRVTIISFIHTMTRGSYICNGCDKLVENEPHLED